METHGFTNEGIPDTGNTVRIDVVGGFALQKVTDNRSYFRWVFSYINIHTQTCRLVYVWIDQLGWLLMWQLQSL